MTPEEKIIAQLMKQYKSRRVADKLAKEMFSTNAPVFNPSNVPKTVGEYYNKYLRKK